jgi:very-short-patch-repair endonuclease
MDIIEALTSIIRSLDSLANLQRANSMDANLTDADLSDADLSDADLSDADLSDADLSDADLSDADLSEANLVRADFTNANLSGAKVDETILAYQKISKDLQRENQELKEKLSILETQFEKLVEREVERRLITNQGIKAKKKLNWKGMRFRSEPEREIAIVLDEMGVMYFPNASGRVMSEDGMTTREIDFLVCSRGKWGILECDGISHILNSIKKGQMPSAALDHKRDNDFNRHGQWFIKRFTAEECERNPHKVVRQFLDMLHKFHEDLRYQITGDSAETKSSQSPKKVFLQSEDLSFPDI